MLLKNAEIIGPNNFAGLPVKKFNNLYPLELWLTCIVLIGPILLFIFSFFFFSSDFDLLSSFFGIMVLILTGLIYSIPTFLFCLVTYKILSLKFRSAIFIKIIFNIISVIGISITFSILGGSFAFRYSIVYSASVIISSLLFKIYPNQKSN